VIIVDSRERGIADELKRFDIPSTSALLDSGDALFEGQGEDQDGKPKLVTVGIERKRLGLERGCLSTDLISSMQDRRLSGFQLNKMAQVFDHVYLFVEGMWRATAMGDIEVSEDGRWWRPLKQRVSHRQVMSYITTLELKGRTSVGNRFVVRRTLNVKETAAQFCDLYAWFNAKPWAEHTSHQQLYAPSPVMERTGNKVGFVDQEEVFKREFGAPALMCWRMAAQLPGIDSKRAIELAKHFRTPQRMCCAGPKEWQRVFGIGPRIAEAAARVLREPLDKAR